MTRQKKHPVTYDRVSERLGELHAALHEFSTEARNAIQTGFKEPMHEAWDRLDELFAAAKKDMAKCKKGKLQEI